VRDDGVMDAHGFRVLASTEGLRLLDEVGAAGEPDDVVRAVSRLRAAGHPPELVAAVLEQARLRRQAVPKFGEFAASMLFTEAGLEQATRLGVAALHAGRFARAGVPWVADLGCGIGADALALAALDLEVTAVDRDEVTAAVAAFNLAPFDRVRVEHADAREVPLRGIGGVWLDPARRSERGRLRDPADWSPPLDFAFSLADGGAAHASVRAVGVKLGPGLDRALIPDGAEAQWVSVDGDVVELALWFGAVARPGTTRAALVIRQGASAELTAPADSPDADPGPLGRYLYEPDGAVIRARLVGDLARSVSGRMLDPRIAYITADDAVPTPFADVFRIDEELRLDERTLRRELAARGIGVLEIKKRGVDVDPARMRERLRLSGDRSATLILTRVGDRRIALLGERLPRTG